ncbi:MAG: hypothetical protein EAZ70_00095 [Runella slithyformis]|jgi:hypothetical protein|nr:MAG: hypothetical protein EAY79_00485 [Runella slithyformis]TAF97603.1 MAG: hypothetical protein EAZ46_01845 [Runella sp.]TAG22511.1 MAG: hypothetical protein EAZ38_05580 [Cytophagales bacterium]TAG41546.1 MAG: hypothetical protein EAZ32_02765 [Cytophagia bacterium]TAF02776.1 MAG: hypothetical protein EAZ80_00665 [Runella slithyformis]
MTTLTLSEVSAMRVKLKNLEARKEDASLSFMDKIEIMDEILELKEQLGEFERKVSSSGNDCEFCSS